MPYTTGALLALLLAVAQTTGPDDGNVTLTAVVHDRAHLSRPVLDRAQAVAARIFRRIGVGLTWLDQHPGGPAADALWDDVQLRKRFLRSLVVVHVLSSPVHVGVPIPAGALGIAVSGTRVLKVFSERVKHVSDSANRDFATVLGHVIAHEVGHLLLPTSAHAPTGLMRHTMDLERAARGALSFSDAEAALIRAAIRRSRVEQVSDHPAAVQR